MEDYDIKNQVGEGDFGSVFKGHNMKKDHAVVIRRIRAVHDREGISPPVIRELSLLKELEHPCLLQLEYLHVDRSHLYLVFPVPTMNLRMYLKSLPEGKFLEPKLVRSYIYQITDAVLYCHRLGILLRRLRPDNVIMDEGDGCLIRLCNFSDLHVAHMLPTTPEDEKALWYVSPEVLLGGEHYASADVWAIGCIFAEIAMNHTLFRGDTETGQLFRIFTILGTPTETSWPGFSLMSKYKESFPKWSENKLPEHLNNLQWVGIYLLQDMLKYNPMARITPAQVLEHKYFEGFRKPYTLD